MFVSSRGDEIQPVPFVAAFDTGSSEPREIANVSSAGETFEGLAATEDYLYAAIHEGGIVVYQLTNGALTERGRVGGLTNAWGVAIRGDLLICRRWHWWGCYL